MERRALVSVTDKTGIVEFARGLTELGIEVLSTGGTFRALQDAGVPAQEVADYTGFPEIMDGRVKTLHPKVHGGILARRDRDEDLAAMEQHGIDGIDVVAVNLYRFRETLARPGVTRDEVVENIDIGGPSMLRSAAKNHAHVTVVVDPADYETVLEQLATERDDAAPAGGGVELRRRLAGKAFAHTAAYDVAIAGWLDDERAAAADEPAFGSRWALAYEKLADLRYGENPHQQAALFADPSVPAPSLARAKQLRGKALSYNNLLDLDAALRAVSEFDEPACVIVKHNNPCGAAVAGELSTAFGAALDGDPVSAFGGIVAFNTRLDEATATAMVERGTFVECIVGPGFDDSALRALDAAKWGVNVRVLDLGGWPAQRPERIARAISGGVLAQTADDAGADPASWTDATKRTPSEDERALLAFAWSVCKHVKSNAIVLAARTETGACAIAGVGAGQMSRVDSVRIAVEKAGPRARGAVLASDAFFPFADGLQTALDAGVTAAAQPGGSRRDDEVVAAADAAGAAMMFTGRRHFLH